MFSIIQIFAFTTLFASIAQSELLSPCHLDDGACFESSLNKALSQLLSENKTLGIESSDPLKVDLIKGDLSGVSYNFASPVTTGFKQCVVKNVKISLEKMTLHFELDCPRLETSGTYEISGRLVALPIEGHGDFKISTGAYNILIDCELKTVVGDDNKAYLSVKTFKLKTEPKSPISFDFKNLFNGQKELAEPVLTFANQNWKEVANILQDPIWYTNMKKVFANINKYLMTEPIDQIFLSS